MLRVIEEYIRDHRYAPSIRDLCDITGLTINGVNGHIKALVKKGYLRREWNAARGLVVVYED